MRLLPIRPLFLAVCTASAAAQTTIVVPADAPDLQAAIDLATDGDLVVVRTATAQDPVTVDKPITILGDPLVNVRIADSGNCFPPAIFLDGRGSGTVVLAGVRTVTGEDCAFPPPAISGGGFEALEIYSSQIFASLSGLTGLGHGNAAISTNVPYLFVNASTIVGGFDNADDCVGALPGGGYPAIDAASSTVTVIDSILSGGRGGLLCCKFGCSCPPTLAGLGGHGGIGIVADRLFAAGSTIQGGIGSTYIAYEGNPFEPPSTVCGKQPDGVPFVVGERIDLPPTLTVDTPLRLGASTTLSWDTPAPTMSLYISTGVQPPIEVTPGNWSFLAPGELMVGVFPAGGGVQSFAFAIPNAQALLGLQVAFQLQDADGVVSRPVAGVLKP